MKLLSKFILVFSLISSISCAAYTLTPKMLNKAKSIRGIKLPAQYDVSEVVLSGRNLDYADFSDVVNLSISELNKASSFIGFKFPKNFDVTGWNTKNRDIAEVDLSSVTGLTARMINKAESIERIILPDGFDMSGVNFRKKSLWRIDFRKTKNLSIKHLNQARSLSEIVLPQGFNLKGLKTKGKDISGIDFSKTLGLTISMLNDASNIDESTFPKGMSFKGFKPSKNKLFLNDFSMVKDFPKKSLNFFHGNSSVILPAINLEGVSLKDKVLSRVSFENVLGLTANSLAEITFLPSKLPNQFDISGVDFKDKVADGFDGTNIVGLTQQKYLDLKSAPWFKFPESFSFSGVDTRGRYLGSLSHLYSCEGAEILNTLTVKQLNSSDNFEFNCFPKGFDIKGLTLEGNRRGLNYSNILGLKGSDFNRVVNMRYSTFPDGFDFKGFKATDTNLKKLDLSKTIGLTTQHLNESLGISQLKLPKMNMKGFDPKGKYLWKVDFSLVKGLTVSMLEKALSLSELKFPDQFDFTGFDTRDRDISFSDFSNMK